MANEKPDEMVERYIEKMVDDFGMSGNAEDDFRISARRIFGDLARDIDRLARSEDDQEQPTEQ